MFTFAALDGFLLSVNLTGRQARSRPEQTLNHSLISPTRDHAILKQEQSGKAEESETCLSRTNRPGGSDLEPRSERELPGCKDDLHMSLARSDHSILSVDQYPPL